MRHPVIASALDGRSRRHILLGGGAAAAALAGLVSGLGRPIAALALSVLLVGLASGMGFLSRGLRVPELLRERLSAARDALPRHSLALREARGAPTEPAPSGADRLKGPEAAGRPAKPPKPNAPPAKPAGAVKPQRAPRPGGAAKPLEAAKPPGAAKVSKPARSAKPKPPSRMKPGAKPQRRGGREAQALVPIYGPSASNPGRSPPMPRTRRSSPARSSGGGMDGSQTSTRSPSAAGRDWIVERSPRFFWPAGDIPRQRLVGLTRSSLTPFSGPAGARWVAKARGIGNGSSARSRLRPNSPTAWTGKRSRPRGAGGPARGGPRESCRRQAPDAAPHGRGVPPFRSTERAVHAW